MTNDNLNPDELQPHDTITKAGINGLTGQFIDKYGHLITYFSCDCSEEAIIARQQEQECERLIPHCYIPTPERHVHRELGDPPGLLINLGLKQNHLTLNANKKRLRQLL